MINIIILWLTWLFCPTHESQYNTTIHFKAWQFYSTISYHWNILYGFLAEFVEIWILSGVTTKVIMVKITHFIIIYGWSCIKYYFITRIKLMYLFGARQMTNWRTNDITMTIFLSQWHDDISWIKIVFII